MKHYKLLKYTENGFQDFASFRSKKDLCTFIRKNKGIYHARDKRGIYQESLSIGFNQPISEMTY